MPRAEMAQAEAWWACTRLPLGLRQTGWLTSCHRSFFLGVLGRVTSQNSLPVLTLCGHLQGRRFQQGDHEALLLFLAWLSRIRQL